MSCPCARPRPKNIPPSVHLLLSGFQRYVGKIRSARFRSSLTAVICRPLKCSSEKIYVINPRCRVTLLALSVCLLLL